MFLVLCLLPWKKLPSDERGGGSYHVIGSLVGRGVRRKPISKSCEITQADNLNRRRRLSRKAQ